MILQGSIQRFDVGSVLQFLAHNAATGILEIRDSEEHGHIYLVGGRVEAISLPLSDDRLGVHLVKTGLLSEGQLARVLVEETDHEGGEGRKPLGQRLVEKGFSSEAIIRGVMCRLTIARIFEIVQWRSGVFAYHEPEEMPDFQIAIKCDVQELLLRAQLRIDNGERPRKGVGAVNRDDLCFGCPVMDCSPGVKQKYLKKDLCLWRTMSTAPDVPSEPRSEGLQVRAYGDASGYGAPQGTWVQF